MARATAWTEAAGIPAVAIACKGFAGTTHLVARAEGLSSLRLVEYPPPNMGVQTRDEVYEYAARLFADVTAALTASARGGPPETLRNTARASNEIVFRGDIDAVNDFFRQNVWTDGLPVMPPTIRAVEAMLKFTDRSTAEVIGVLPPKRFAATIWKIAVNGVMAGCRPEYLPVLIALVEAIAEPRFGLEHAGSTAGWTPLIILNGPIIKELGFNSGQGVLRPQPQANITVSRFLRLCMVNIAGYRLGETDMASFGRNYHPVIAEAQDESPWSPLSVDRGFDRGANVVTVQSISTMGHAFLTEGDGHNHLRYLAKEVAIELGGPTLQAMGMFGNEISPILCMTPLVAGIIAKAGYSKRDVKQYIFDHARIPARELDERLRRRRPGLTDRPGQAIKNAVKSGILPGLFDISEDPDRLIPVVHRPEEFLIVVAGPATRNRSFIGSQLGNQGLTVSKEIRLPPYWKGSLEK